jgi:uncharacterized membrane protein
VTTLILGSIPSALAASGGRMGGGSFRAPSRSISPSRGGGYSSPGYGGGIGFPFLLPFFWGGGGGGFRDMKPSPWLKYRWVCWLMPVICNKN